MGSVAVTHFECLPADERMVAALLYSLSDKALCFRLSVISSTATNNPFLT